MRGVVLTSFLFFLALFFLALRVFNSTIGKYQRGWRILESDKQSTEKSVPPVTPSTESLGVILSAFHTL